MDIWIDGQIDGETDIWRDGETDVCVRMYVCMYVCTCDYLYTFMYHQVNDLGSYCLILYACLFILNNLYFLYSLGHW